MERFVCIIGARTLYRFTYDMLAKGFEANNWRVQVLSPGELPNTDFPPTALLVQVHGAPQSAQDDSSIIEFIETLLNKHSSDVGLAPPRLAILVHRPDELPLIHPNFHSVLEKSNLKRSPMPFHLVFLGDKHVDDPAYSGIGDHMKKHVIPHCFFRATPRFREDAVVIGTFTTWGEMRSVDNVLKLLLALFKLRTTVSEPRVVGYLGGRPVEDISPAKVKDLCEKIDPSISIATVDARSISDNLGLSQLYSSECLILLDAESESLTPQFNTQLYHLNKAIRTGESSGSVHSNPGGIPVILEMNGSEVIEGLSVIKVPYSDVRDIESVDYAAGAAAISRCLDDDTYLSMLEHNIAQSQQFNNQFSASSYAKLFRS